MSVSASNMSKELNYEYYLILSCKNKYFFQIIDGKYRNLHFSTFIYNEQVLNIVIFSKYFGYTVSISPITKCRVGEIDTMILKFLHGVKKHPNLYLYERQYNSVRNGTTNCQGSPLPSRTRAFGCLLSFRSYLIFVSPCPLVTCTSSDLLVSCARRISSSLSLIFSWVCISKRLRSPSSFSLSAAIRLSSASFSAANLASRSDFSAARRFSSRTRRRSSASFCSCNFCNSTASTRSRSAFTSS